MKNFLKQFLKLAFLSLIVAVIVFGVSYYNFRNKEPERVHAGTGDNMNGFAWSGNIGWISFNSANCDTDNDGQSNGGTGCPAIGTAVLSYGAKLEERDDTGIGILSGYAWSEYIGLISFNRGDTGDPQDSFRYDPGKAQIQGSLAYLDTNNKLQGWARALVACDSVPCTISGPGANSGGWDGWIALGDTKPSVNPVYGVSLNTVTKEFNGWAWGSDVIGWMSFNKSNCDIDNNGYIDTGNCGGDNSTTPIANYKISTTFELNQTPNAPSDNSLSATPQYCYASTPGYLEFKWTFSDPNLNSANKQSKYQIEMSYNSSFLPSDSVYSVINNTTGNSNPENFSVNIGLNDIKNSTIGSWYGKTLYWKVTVWDDGTFSKSATSAIKTFGPMPNREYPKVTFYSNPALDKIFANQDTQFSPDKYSLSDKTICYDSGSTSASCAGWTWNIADATPASSTDKEPIVKFSSAGSKSVTLKARDSGGYECTATRTINIGLSLPKIQEKK